MRREVAEQLMQMDKASYDAVALSFAQTRKKFWPELLPLLNYTNPGDHVLDIGCGNGRFYTELKSKGVKYMGVDNSQGLISIAQATFPEATFVCADALLLPFNNNEFDIIYSFATIHHIPSNKFRTQFITEANRALKPGGKLVISTWYLWQKKYIYKLISQSISAFLGLSKYDNNDLVFPMIEKDALRYVHAFRKNELVQLLNHNGLHVDECTIIKRPSGQMNLVIVATKN